MKAALLLMLIVCFLLSGCITNIPDVMQPVATQQTTEPSVPETQPSLYIPGSSVEQQTEGAVRAYSLDENCSGIVFKGKQLLLFLSDGYGPTLATQLDLNNERIEKTVELSGNVSFESIQISAGKLAYYSTLENAVIVLDDSFRESFRVSMPEDMDGIPLIRENMTEAYYSVGTDIRAMNLDTGISRLLRQRDCRKLSVDAILFQGTVLQCSVTEENGESCTEFISTDTGETLGSDDNLLMLHAWQSNYLLQRTEGAIREVVFGTVDDTPQCLLPESTDELRGVLPFNHAIAVFRPDGGGIGLRLYDLVSGKKVSETQIESISDITYIAADPEGEYLWFVSKDSRGNDTLYRWEFSVSEVAEETVYTAQRYTASSPDTAGLAQCRAYADTLESQYGITIQIENDTILSKDYAYIYEYHVQAVTLGLEALEKALSAFPEGFFTTLGQLSASGKIHVSLVRSMTGRTNAVPTDAVGFQYWLDGTPNIVLSIGDRTEQAFYNAVSLVLDTHVLNESLAYDDWEQWNPEGFSYDENYTDFAVRKDRTWLEGENRAFVDAFSMTFPREDRAKILEYAMQEGNQEVFQSETMQRKLYQICKGIRDAFGWEKDERTFHWEQYLNESLAYTKE